MQVHLDLRATGRIEGNLRYAGMQIERGGKVIGAMEELPSRAAVPEEPQDCAPEDPEASGKKAGRTASAASEPTTA